jgi:cellulose synthase/poly-beta-1,6-N-acetylglucosamine synthase-like glycosyltransferase
VLAALVFPGLIILFIVTQAGYFVSNVLADLLIFRNRPALVDEERDPAEPRHIHVLLPVYREERDVVELTLDRIFASAYPRSLLTVYLIYEPRDETVASYADDIVAEAIDREWTVQTVVVDQGTLASYIDKSEWDLAGASVPRTKAAAIKYAFRTLSLPPEDVVTVFDADTIVPDDTFRLAITGLETSDIVQTKQTVRNLHDGWLPRLEAMGMAAWSHAIYARTTRGPYQLLGKAYFVRVADLWELGDWRVNAITEDLALGIDAYRAGFSLGVIDRYVQDICPATFPEWVAQKRRWAAGPYPYLRSRDLTLGETLRFWTYGIANQFVAAMNVVGVPTGIIYLLFVLAGFDLYNSPPLVAVTLVNLCNWVYYSWQSYRATIDGVVLSSRREALWFYLTTNPLTQLVYSMLWAIPISLAVWDVLTGRQQTDFVVTPKQLGPTVEQRPDD